MTECGYRWNQPDDGNWLTSHLCGQGDGHDGPHRCSCGALTYRSASVAAATRDGRDGSGRLVAQPD